MVEPPRDNDKGTCPVLLEDDRADNGDMGAELPATGDVVLALPDGE